MVNPADWSTTPANNTTVDGINIAEGCPAGNMNAMGRAIMAGVKTLYNSLPNVANYLLKDGSVAMTGQLSRASAGAYLFHNTPANSSGRVFVQAAGGATPTMADGDFLIEYS